MTAALLCVALVAAACGSGSSTPSAHDAVATAARVEVGSESSAGAVQTWKTTTIARSGRRYTVDADGAKVGLWGIGYPGTGSGSDARFVGPGVAKHWTTIEHGRYVVAMRHRGRWLGLRVWSRGGQWRAKVDGKYVDPRPRSVGSDYALHTIGLDFSQSDPDKRRVVEFELRGGAWLAGIVAGEGDKVSAPPRPHGRSLYWLGDSFFVGTGARYAGFTDLVEQATARLGSDDSTVDALGGTGYVQDNVGAKYDDYLTRARANLGKGRARPDVVVVGGSINDINQDPKKVQKAARRLYAYIARALPSAKVVVVPFAPHYPVPSNFAALNRAVLRAAAASPNVIGALDLDARLPRSRAGLQRPDGHPTQAGHDRYGRLVAAFIRSRLAHRSHGGR